MTKIQIIQVREFSTDHVEMKKRLRSFLQEFRARKITRQLVGDDEWSAELDDIEAEISDAAVPGSELTYKDEAAIADRVRCLVAKRIRASGTAHLKDDDRERLSPKEACMRAIMAPSEHWADGVAAALNAEMPWMGRATETAWHDLRRAARRGTPIKIQPLLLNGPLGIGKSAWTRSLANRLKLPMGQSDAGAGSAGFDIAGVERGWGSSTPGRPVNLLLDHRIANPIFVVDEICKAGVEKSTSGRVFSLTEAMLGLMEPGSARAWNCPYFRVTFDMSHFSWLFTANQLDTVPEPFLSRCQIVEVQDIEPLLVFRRLQIKEGLEPWKETTERTAIHLRHEQGPCGWCSKIRATTRVRRRRSKRLRLRLAVAGARCGVGFSTKRPTRARGMV